jgi:hypothetical protein
MRLDEYAALDATALAGAIRKGEVSAKEVAGLAAEAISLVNPKVNAVVETYDDNIKAAAVADGPFAGVPFLIKDVRGHLGGRKAEFGSRLAEGYVAEADTHYGELVKKAGFNIVGRSNAPEYSIATSTENLLYGNTSTPWREGYSAGGSTGGGASAVAAGGSACGARLRHRRLDPHPGKLVRRCWPEAVARAHLVRPAGRRRRLWPQHELRADPNLARYGCHPRLPVRAAAGRSVHHPHARGRLCALARQEPRKLAHRLDHSADDGCTGGSGSRGGGGSDGKAARSCRASCGAG